VRELALQTTLLGLAIAIILALVAALVGPLLIDWGSYRSIFETEATRLAGVEVRVKGDIDARLLPSPQLTLRDIEIGAPGPEQMRARSLDIEFALAPLVRGEWQASELHLTGPQMRLGLDKNGQVATPNLDVGFKPEAIAIERLSIDDGRLTLTDAANGGSVTLENLYFNGAATSLRGPYRGEGDVVVAGSHYPYRLSAGRYDDDGNVKLHVNVDPRDRPLNFEVDGTLSLAAGSPNFDGKWRLVRPAGIAAGGGELNQPWQLSGTAKAKAASALLENIEFAYGSEEHELKLTGLADFQFGKTPRLKLLISGHQLDLDGALAASGAARSSPGAAMRRLADLAAGAFRPTIPMQIGIDVDQLTLAGDSVQNVGGDISADANGWNLNSFEFRAPGFTQARLSGHLTIGHESVSFTGPAEIESNNPKALAAWLEGRPPTGQGELRPLSMRGQLTLGSERIAIEQLTASFARKPITGRFAYIYATNGHPSRLEASLNAPELDLDLALGFGKALFAGSALERPHDMAITADIGHGTLGGIEARNISARIKVDADHWQIDRLAVADLGGAAFAASGGVSLTPAPQGSLHVDFDARGLAPVTALLARFAPSAAQVLESRAQVLAPVKLQAQLTVDGQAQAGNAKLDVNGSLGKLRLTINGDGQLDAKAFSLGELKLAAKLASDDGKALIETLGLGSAVSAAPGPAALTLDANGAARGDWRVDAHLTAGNLRAAANGTANPFGDSPSAALRVSISGANAAPLREPGGGNVALPVDFTGDVALNGGALTLSAFTADVAGAAVRGTLTFGLAGPRRLQGEIDADRANGPMLVAAAIGMPFTVQTKPGGGWSWADAPFASGLLGNYTGEVAFKARQLDVSPRLMAREFRATLRFDKNALTVDDMAGVIGGGNFTGVLAFRADKDGLNAHATLSLTGADSAVLLPAAARPAVTGSLGLSLELDGAGLSPAALVGSLHGAGKLTLDNGELAGLDPRAFDAVTHAVDQGLSVDNNRIADIVQKALDSGQLSIVHAESALAVNAGQIRLREVKTKSKDADLALSGGLDLIDGSLDARLVLSGADKAGGVRPDIFMALSGPLAAPSRFVDVSSLTGWLTLRAVENQARQIRAIEEATPKPAPPPAVPKVEPPATAPGDHSAAPPTEPAPLSANEQSAPQKDVKKLSPTASREPLQLMQTKPTMQTQPPPQLPPPVEIAPLPPPSVGPQN